MLEVPAACDLGRHAAGRPSPSRSHFRADAAEAAPNEAEGANDRRRKGAAGQDLGATALVD
ncbi:hypothetical protein FV232_16200 [Methylobacterium sp. WL30]|uniref:hypothetical protein n=1 Tax=unclassified Methylobacterium TaxID=2615210 RepID=UPI0011C7AD99|nr:MULTISPECIES: hypothetical protein [unclassified Methylobacterium]TXM92663.1 hypothetical protein FV223_11035 [Methylobacterium sp. WL116]TXN40538.1 hypothetical protein FV225_05730 [Methylobacterium sp. WL93]TXN49653.1 hypothetical protein FV227_15620 [Methylobacterium sp. WL119]TXN64712.1 hypothetical protein FV230_18005 [Methylobacterium sp. WL6]TXN66139.1 hypothetical protein FV232_16200 [Methylobacterium sp. WL30]